MLQICLQGRLPRQDFYFEEILSGERTRKQFSSVILLILIQKGWVRMEQKLNLLDSLTQREVEGLLGLEVMEVGEWAVRSLLLTSWRVLVVGALAGGGAGGVGL